MPTGTFGTYNPGDINNGDGTNGPNLTGDASEYVFKLPSAAIDGTYTATGNTQAHTFSSYNIGFGTNRWEVEIDYAPGTVQYYDNKGNPGTNLDLDRVAGNRSDYSNTVSGRRYAWYDASTGAAPTSSANIRVLPKQFLSTSNTGTFDIIIPIGIKEVFFYVPTGKSIQVNYEESFDFDVTGDFSSTPQSVNDAGGTPQSYNLYETTIPGIGYGALATYRVTIT